MSDIRAMALTGPRSLELITLPRPVIGAAEALMRVEAAGMCGTDHEVYQGALEKSGLIEHYPVIAGHEPVGVIEEIGDAARHAWGVDVGDRVAVEPFASCGVCRDCASGNYPLCACAHRYGFTPTSVGPGLWGAFAEYMVLRGNTILHRLGDGLTPEDAVLFNPLGGGFDWVCDVGGVRPGDTVVIAGPGQRGMAATVAAREAGAGVIIVAGTHRDDARMALCRDLGADVTVDVDERNLVDEVRAATGGQGADVFLDLSPYATQPVLDGLASVRRGGTVVLVGLKGMREVPGFVSDRIVLDALTVKGGMGVHRSSYARAISALESGKYPALGRMHTHTLPLTELERGLQLLGNELDEQAIHITIRTEVRA